jgi:parallel beta-helix repeat protein
MNMRGGLVASMMFILVLSACGGGEQSASSSPPPAANTGAAAPTSSPSPTPSQTPPAGSPSTPMPPPDVPMPPPAGSPTVPTPPAPLPPVGAGTRWSEPATWGGVMPTAGAAVVIPVGKTVILDTQTTALKGLTIEGTLVADPDVDIGITSDYVFVKGGRLQIGSASQPYLRNATITLTGSSVADNPATAGFGNKVLAMMGGTMEMHGRPVAASWTKLDGGDVAAGARTIRLASAPGWKPGDQIVIATSNLNQGDYSLATIESINGNVVNLREPTRFRHFGEKRQVGDIAVDVRAEVGLLTQNIVVQGDSASQASNIGGHAMLMAGGSGPTTVQMANVLFQRMGQLNNLGRYPLHFHLMGNACSNCYVRNATIRDSIQRGIVLHDTSNLTVAGNVVFNTVGHNIVIETETTKGNLLEGNLALVNREPSPAHTEPTLFTQNDQNPANFWIRGAENAVIGNASAGSQANGFIYDTPGPGNFNFRGNVVHAAMSQESKLRPGDFDTTAGVMIAVGGRPAGVKDQLLDTLAYHNAHGLWAEESEVPFVFDRFIVAENSVNGVQNRGVGSQQIFRNGVFIGVLPNSGVLSAAAGVMHNQYGSDNLIENATFANYASGAGLGGTDTGPTQASYTISGARFIGTPGFEMTDLGRFTFKDDSALPRGFYVHATVPWVAPPGAATVNIGGYPMLRAPVTPNIAELEVRIAPSASFSNKIAATVTRSDGLRYSIASGPGGGGAGLHSTTVLAGLPNVSYALEQASSYYAARLWDTGGNLAVQRGDAMTLVSVAMPAAPRTAARAPTVVDTGNPGGDPGTGDLVNPNALTITLQPAASIAELNANPRNSYFYDAGSKRLWTYVNSSWLVLSQ